jgi:hypothetical protein
MRLSPPGVLPEPASLNQRVPAVLIVADPTGYDQHMEREFPAGLSEDQRSVLCEFFKGHISAGQLTQRLGIEAPESTGEAASVRPDRVHELHPDSPRDRAAGTAKALRGRLAL